MNDSKNEFQLEAELDTNFINEVKNTPGGEKIVDCIQCGTCSGSCPTGFLMKHSPRKIFGMIRAGMRKEVLDSPDIWLCTSCYSCYVRCPQNIKITDIMYALKRISSKEKYPIQKRGYHLAKNFMNVVNKYGRNFEPELLVRFFLRANPVGLIKNASIGFNLFKKGRMPIFHKKIKDLDGFRAITKKADTL